MAATLVLAAGFALAHTATDGFQAFTLESARRLHALTAQAALPELALDLADGRRARLSEMPGQVLLVDFIYTNCPTYCAALGSVYAQIGRRLEDEIATGKVRLVSISFDPARDGPAELIAYHTRYGGNANGWDLGRPAQAADLERWLNAFGVVVIPDGLGGYTHNAAVHVVGPDRRLAAIHGLEDLDAVVTTARRMAGTDASHVASR
jgi:protein SCO1/2